MTLEELRIPLTNKLIIDIEANIFAEGILLYDNVVIYERYNIIMEDRTFSTLTAYGYNINYRHK